MRVAGQWERARPAVRVAMGRSSSLLSALVAISGLLAILVLAPDPPPSRLRAATVAPWADVPAAAVPADTTPVTQYPPKPEVVVVGQPQAEPSARMQAASPTRAPPRPGDRTGIARELQRELRRVGCYWGEVNGTWTPATRKAAKTFTERVNAALPDEPDLVLLALVQAQEGEVCGAGCPAGQALAADGRCLPSAILESRRGQPPARAAVPPQPAAPAITLQSSARTGTVDPPPTGEARPPQPPVASALAGVQLPAPGAGQPVMRPGHAKQSAAPPAAFGPRVFRHFDNNGF